MSGFLFLFLFAIRSRIVPFNPNLWDRTLFAAYHDALYCLLILGLFLLLFAVFRKQSRALGILNVLFMVVCAVSLLLAMANVKIVWLLARPLSYQWLYYSDFFRSLETRNAVLGILSDRDLFKMTAVLFSFLALSFLPWSRVRRPHPVVILLLLYLVCSIWMRPKRNKEFFANPVLYFISSGIQATQAPALLTMKAPPFLPPPTVSNVTFRPAEKLNVVIFVLESVPAHYLELYGAKFPVTPNITAAAKKALLFENFYAHSPSSTSSLVSLLLSIYPNLSYRHLIESSPHIEFPSLSGEIKKLGYQTGYFNSADNGFHRANEFLSRRDFDALHDYRSIPCERPIGAEASTFRNGADDSCTMEAFFNWQKGKGPFFAIVWTMMTHFPYFLPQTEKDFGVEYEPLHRYLNALHYADQLFGKMMSELERRNLADSTLVIVVGDHGESFGEHRVHGHTKLYENIVRVPLLMMNSRLLTPGRSQTLGGLIDLAPTILDLLGNSPPALWQGRSLFSKRRLSRVYFFSPWSGFLFGYREGSKKYIYDAIEDTSELYELLKDPNELQNLKNENTSLHQERLASWAQYHNSFMKSLSRQDPR